MKDIKFDEILKRENGEYIMRLKFPKAETELLVNTGCVEVVSGENCAEEIEALLYALPRVNEASSFVISGAPCDLPEDAILSAAEKNWSIII